MALGWRQKCHWSGWMMVLGVGATLTSTVNSVFAQVVPDTSLPQNSAVTSVDNNFTITGGTQLEGNLFHSFSQFSVPTLGEAFFNNVSTVQNIISRVTGASISNIDGTLRANSTANLFLINANGIVFGRNARLDIGGSFIASTANSLNFADNTRFSATAPQTTPLLTISAPIGLQFGENPRSIQVQGNGQGLRRSDSPIIDTNNALRVQPNQTLALVGGDILLEGGTLKTAGGRIELGSVAEAGLVSLAPVSKGFSLGYDGVTNYGNIQLRRATAVDASGENGGDIQVRGRQITLQGGSQIEASILRTAPGGTLRVTASELVELSGSTADNPGDNRRIPTSISIDNREAGQIPGELTINTQRLIVQNGARVSASNTQTGLGGNITVNASNEVQLIGTGLSQGGLRSSGLSVQTRGAGNAGNLTINTKRLIIKDGAEASASTFGAGNGGVVTVNASDLVELSGASENGELRSRLVAGVGRPEDVLRNNAPRSSGLESGRGGNLIVKTGQLTVGDGAVLAVSSRSNNRNAQGAGSLEVTANSIRLNNRGAISAETFSGQGGDITLQVQDLLLLRGNSQISTTAGTQEQGGNGGNITINAPFLISVPQENSDITANAFSGQGGRITINAQGVFYLEPRTLQEIQQLLQTTNPIELNPFRLPTNDITAISQTNPNLSGQVTINTPDVDRHLALVNLPTIVVDASALIASGCEAFAGTEGSSFIVTGRGGLPPSPDEPLSNDIVWSDTRLTNIKSQQVSENQSINASASANPDAKRTKIIPATAWVFNNKGEVTLIAHQAKATPESLESYTTKCLQ